MKSHIPFSLFFSLLCFLGATTNIHADPSLVRLATTTSTVNTGLLDVLKPHFEAEEGLELHVSSVGTGRALGMGRKGEADVVLVHAIAAERQFINDKHGIRRFPVMYNDFILVGPKEDPAGIRNVESATKALAGIALNKSGFVSRADDSGTHKRELAIWKKAEVEPSGVWYFEAGLDMSATLSKADELGFYTLIDRGTWLAHRKIVSLKVIFEGDETLFNPYGVTAVNPARHSKVNVEGANVFIKWITSKPIQQLIANFEVDGERLFVPSAEN